MPIWYFPPGIGSIKCHDCTAPTRTPNQSLSRAQHNNTTTEDRCSISSQASGASAHRTLKIARTNRRATCAPGRLSTQTDEVFPGESVMWFNTTCRVALSLSWELVYKVLAKFGLIEQNGTPTARWLFRALLCGSGGVTPKGK